MWLTLRLDSLCCLEAGQQALLQVIELLAPAVPASQKLISQHQKCRIF